MEQQIFDSTLAGESNTKLENLEPSHFLYGKFRVNKPCVTIDLSHLKRIQNTKGKLQVLLGTPSNVQKVALIEKMRRLNSNCGKDPLID